MTLIEFARVMEEKLEENTRRKHGWETASDGYLLRRLKQETGELARALKDKRKTGREVAREAADVANFAFMLADNAEQEDADGDRGPKKPEEEN